MFDFRVVYIVDGMKQSEIIIAYDAIEATDLFRRIHPVVRILSVHQLAE